MPSKFLEVPPISKGTDPILGGSDMRGGQAHTPRPKPSAWVSGREHTGGGGCKERCLQHGWRVRWLTRHRAAAWARIISTAGVAIAAAAARPRGVRMFLGTETWALGAQAAPLLLSVGPFGGPAGAQAGQAGSSAQA
jgi:hypothetical protein